jgi:hypothetical protein
VQTVKFSKQSNAPKMQKMVFGWIAFFLPMYPTPKNPIEGCAWNVEVHPKTTFLCDPSSGRNRLQKIAFFRCVWTSLSWLKKDDWVREHCFVPGLPDVMFSYQKSKFGYVLERLWMENVGMFYCHLEFAVVIWYILWWFVKFAVIWYIFSIKSGKPATRNMYVLLRCKTRRLTAFGSTRVARFFFSEHTKTYQKHKMYQTAMKLTNIFR